MTTPAFALILVGSTLSLAAAGCRKDAPVADRSADRYPDRSSTASESRPVTADSSPATAADARPLIVCFGDSLTAGYGTDSGQSYPDYLQALLNGKGFAYRVMNSGISGNTTKDGLQRVGRIIARKPEVVVLEFGGNDGLRGLPLDQTETNLDAMLTQLKAAGVKVALAGITLPPDYGPDYIRRFTTMYSGLARKFKVPLLPFLLKDVYGVAGGMQADSTHATAQGNQQVARNVAQLIEPMLKH